MYIPKRLQPYFEVTSEKYGTNIIVDGILTCCGSHEFDISFYGDLKQNWLGNKTLHANDNGLILNAKCKKCGKDIQVFNSFIDGYDPCSEKVQSSPKVKTNHIVCSKCSKDGFALSMTFEYQTQEELHEEGIDDYENAFSWIWVTIKCNTCGLKFKNFVDYETS